LPDGNEHFLDECNAEIRHYGQTLINHDKSTNSR